MKEFLKILNLSDDEIDIYIEILNGKFLTYNEINSHKPNVSVEDFNLILNNLIEQQLLLEIKPKGSRILTHYMAIPPLLVLNNGLDQITKELSSKEKSAFGKIENEIGSIFQKQSKIELDKIYKDFQILQNAVNSDITAIKQEVEVLSSDIEKESDFTDFLNKYEQELKNIINSELASIVIILLHLKSEFRDKIKALGITDKQWDALKNDIKDVLALGVHEKSQELNEIVTNEFSEIREIIGEKAGNILEDRFEQKSIYLGILSLFKKQIDKLNKVVLLKKNNLELDLKSLQKSISDKMIESFQNLTKKSSASLGFIVDFFHNILNDYYNENNLSFDKYWPVNSKTKIFEEISSLLDSSRKFLFIVVPRIKDYIDIKKLENSPNDLIIKIVSSESHNNNVVKDFTKEKENIEYLRLKNNNLIGISSDNSYAVIGVEQNAATSELNNIVGFGTDYNPLIDLLQTFFSEKLKEAKPPKQVQINDGFNEIIENINSFKGKKISAILQNVLDIAFKMEGISLNILDIKLLISKLKSINTPLSDDLKKGVIEEIETLNKKFSKLELIPTPEFKPPSIKVSRPETKDIASQTLIVSEKEGDKIDIESINNLFDIFLEKMDDMSGKEVSKQIENVIDLSIKFQGYSSIVEWKNDLKDVDTVLDEPFREKIKEDFINWKQSILIPRTTEASQTKDSVVEIESSKQVDLDEMEYSSPALEELAKEQEEIESEPEEAASEQNLTEILSNISLQLDGSKGFEISRELQDIMDIVLETRGYSLELKDMRQWISKLRMIRDVLEQDIREEFLIELEKWKSVLG